MKKISNNICYLKNNMYLCIIVRELWLVEIQKYITLSSLLYPYSRTDMFKSLGGVILFYVHRVFGSDIFPNDLNTRFTKNMEMWICSYLRNSCNADDLRQGLHRLSLKQVPMQGWDRKRNHLKTECVNLISV